MKYVTVNRLRKWLDEAIENGHGRKRIMIADNMDEFVAPLDDFRVEFIPESDGDGFNIENKDGTERGRVCIVLSS